MGFASVISVFSWMRRPGDKETVERGDQIPFLIIDGSWLFTYTLEPPKEGSSFQPLNKGSPFWKLAAKEDVFRELGEPDELVGVRRFLWILFCYLPQDIRLLREKRLTCTQR